MQRAWKRKKDWKEVYTHANVVISGWLVKIISFTSNRISAKASWSEKKIYGRNIQAHITFWPKNRLYNFRHHWIQVLTLSLESLHFPPFFLFFQKAGICFLLYSSPSESSNILILCLTGPRGEECLLVALAEVPGESLPGALAHACSKVSPLKSYVLYSVIFICYLLDYFFLNSF